MDQIEEDIRAGYRYLVETADGDRPIERHKGTLRVGETAVLDLPPYDLSADGPWRGWVEIAAGDAEYYRSQRTG
jgi:hypothetical protein